MNKIRLLLLLNCALFVTLSLNAQKLKDAPQIIPTSPEAAALGKFGDWPVSLYTGTTQINVPLYNINLRELTLPVQLSYHGSGIKVEDVASWVGTGWALEAGGLITRSVQGWPDENGYMVNRVAIDTFPKVFDARQQKDYQMLMKITDLKYDTEPDAYYFNFGGLSGRFYIDKNGDMKSMPMSNIKVVRHPIAYRTPATENYWEILDDKGITYILGQNQNVEKTRSMDDDAMFHETVTTGWYLNKIISSNKQDSIVFTYDDKSEYYSVKPTQSYRIPEYVPRIEGITNGVILNSGYGYSKNLGDAPQSGHYKHTGKNKITHHLVAIRQNRFLCF